MDLGFKDLGFFYCACMLCLATGVMGFRNWFRIRGFGVFLLRMHAMSSYWRRGIQEYNAACSEPELQS